MKCCFSHLGKCIFYTLYLALFNGCWCVAQVESAPVASASIKTFALSPDQNGLAANSVNLFTGDLALPLNLVSLTGRNGLDVNVSLSYSTAGVRNTVNTWNLEAPAGALGLGWSLNAPKIIVNHKQTTARDDDEYYLLEGGSSVRLVRTTSGYESNRPAYVPVSNIGNYYVYEARSLQPWRIRFYYKEGQPAEGGTWEITREDGTKYIYGNDESLANTVQWTVRWQNWIGNSSQPTSQRMSHAWNLWKIINTWGDQVTFEYEFQERFVGASTYKQTEASYLKRITDPLGRKVEFTYADKLAQFYQEPHTEQAENDQSGDAYQEFYEKKYLDYLSVINEKGSVQLTVDFSYDATVSNGTGTDKMLLTSIVQKNKDGLALPGMGFEYYTDPNIKGYLKKITLPTKGTITYAYKTTGNEIGHSSHSIQMLAPGKPQQTNNYAEPKVWIGEDYVVVAWRELNGDDSHNRGHKKVKLYLYQWTGEWKEQFLGDISNVELETDLNMGANGILYRSNYKEFQVVLQKNFFAVLSRTSTTAFLLNIYSKSEVISQQWGNSTDIVSQGTGSEIPTLLSGESFVAVGTQQSGGIVTHTYTGAVWRREVINTGTGDYFYTATNNYIWAHDEDGSPDKLYLHYLREDKKWQTQQVGSTQAFHSANRGTRWYASNSFVLGMIDGQNEFIYQWDPSYGSILRTDVLGGLNDQSPVALLNDNMIAIINKVARFDGVNWNVTTTNPLASYDYTYGEDLVSRYTELISTGGFISGAKIGRRVYNPNSRLWETDVILTASSPFTKAGINYLYMGGDCYYRMPNGQWNKIATLTSNPSSSSWKQGYGFDTQSPTETASVHLIKNGNLTTSNLTYIASQFYQLSNNSLKGFGYSTLVNGKSIVSVPISGSYEFANQRLLTLNRLVDDKTEYKQNGYPVERVTVNDGSSDTHTSYEYNFATALADGSGNPVLFNEVTTIPGSNTAASKPNGYSKTFFNNGLKKTSQEPNLPTDAYVMHMGLSYKTQVYNAQSQLISQSETTYNNYEKDLKNADNVSIDKARFVRPLVSFTSIDGVKTQFTQLYDSNTGLLTSQMSEVATGASLPTRTQVDYKYFWEYYDINKEKNLLLPAVYTKTTIITPQNTSGKVIEATAITYKQSNGVYAPYKSYQWLRSGTGAFDFTNWSDTGEPTTDWKKVSQIDKYDSKGNVQQTTSF